MALEKHTCIMPWRTCHQHAYTRLLPFPGVCNLQNNIDSVIKLLFPFRLSWRVRMTNPYSYVVIHTCIYSLAVMYNYTFGMIILDSH